MKDFILLIVFLVGFALSATPSILVTKYFVKDTKLAIKIVLANLLVMGLINKLFVK